MFILCTAELSNSAQQPIKGTEGFLELTTPNHCIGVTWYHCIRTVLSLLKIWIS